MDRHTIKIIKTMTISLLFYVIWLTSALFLWNKVKNNEHIFAYMSVFFICFMFINYKLRLYLFDKYGV